MTKENIQEFLEDNGWLSFYIGEKEYFHRWNDEIQYFSYNGKEYKSVVHFVATSIKQAFWFELGLFYVGSLCERKENQ